MIPSKKQWKKWSLPNKYSALALLLTLLLMGWGIIKFLVPIIIKPQKKELFYKVLSISKFKKHELSQIAKKEKIDYFNLNLDDPLLTDYYMINIRLQNKGVAIKSPLKFNVLIKNPYTKILDIKHKVITPSNKYIALTNSIPPFIWDLNEHNYDFDYTITHENPYILSGFNIYQSVEKNVGYGRANEKIITKQTFKIPYDPFKTLSTVYYCITAVGVNGLESGLSEPFKFPDFLAFGPYFKNLYWIDPNMDLNSASNGSANAPFPSLSEAIKKTNKSAFFINKRDKEPIKSNQTIPNDIKVFNADTLKFLNGRTNIFIEIGIDENSDIRLFFLFKAIVDKQLEFNLSLEGSPEIKIKQGGIKKWNFEQSKQKNNLKRNQKAFLTPSIVKTYLGQNTIYLAWEKPKNSGYNGVRIFRKTKKSGDNLNAVGKELYEGHGNADTLYCTFENRKPIYGERKINKVSRFSPLTSLQPPRRKDSEYNLPDSPKGFKVETSVAIEDVKLLYFSDKTVSPGMVYTYTLFAYDKNNNYSFPILINASLSDWSETYGCYSKLP